MYTGLDPDQSKALTSFYTNPGCDTTFCFGELVNKWLASKLSTVKLSYLELGELGCVRALSEQQPTLCCVALAEDITIWAS